MLATKTQINDQIKQQFKYDFHSAYGLLEDGENGLARSTYYTDVLVESGTPQFTEFYYKYNRAFSIALEIDAMFIGLGQSTASDNFDNEIQAIVDIEIPELQIQIYGQVISSGGLAIPVSSYEKIRIPQAVNLVNQNINVRIRVIDFYDADDGTSVVGAGKKCTKRAVINVKFYFAIY